MNFQPRVSEKQFPGIKIFIFYEKKVHPDEIDQEFEQLSKLYENNIEKISEEDDLDFDFWAVYPDDPEELEDQSQMRVLIGVEPTADIPKEMVEHILGLNPALRKASLSPCDALHCQMPQVDDINEQQRIDEKVDQAMEDYHDAHNLEMKDPRQAMRVEKFDDEKGVAEVYSNIKNFKQFFDLFTLPKGTVKMESEDGEEEVEEEEEEKM